MAPSRIVFQLESQPSWFENIAVRPSGMLLATRLDIPALMEIDPSTGRATILLTIPDARGLTGIAEISPDKWALGAGDYALATGSVPGTWSVWLADLTSQSPSIKRVTETVPAIGLLNGLAKWDEQTVLAADSFNGTIYKIDISAGKAAIWLQDELLSPVEPVPIGVNGIKVYNSHVYFTNSARQAIYRVPVTTSLQVTGPIEVVVSGSVVDDLCFSDDGTLYVADPIGHQVFKLLSGGKELVVLAGNASSLEVAGGTACALGRRQEDRNVLYVTTGGALANPVEDKTEPAKIVAIDLDG